MTDSNIFTVHLPMEEQPDSDIWTFEDMGDGFFQAYVSIGGGECERRGPRIKYPLATGDKIVLYREAGYRSCSGPPLTRFLILSIKLMYYPRVENRGAITVDPPKEWFWALTVEKINTSVEK